MKNGGSGQSCIRRTNSSNSSWSKWDFMLLRIRLKVSKELIACL